MSADDLDVAIRGGTAAAPGAKRAAGPGAGAAARAGESAAAGHSMNGSLCFVILAPASALSAGRSTQRRSRDLCRVGWLDALGLGGGPRDDRDDGRLEE